MRVTHFSMHYTLLQPLFIICGHQNWWRLLSSGKFTPRVCEKFSSNSVKLTVHAFYPTHGCSKFWWNCGQFLQDYTAACLRNRHLYSHCRYAFKYRPAFMTAQCIPYWSREYMRPIKTDIKNIRNFKGTICKIRVSYSTVSNIIILCITVKEEHGGYAKLISSSASNFTAKIKLQS
jgi:hypothetical protein